MPHCVGCTHPEGCQNDERVARAFNHCHWPLWDLVCDGVDLFLGEFQRISLHSKVWEKVCAIFQVWHCWGAGVGLGGLQGMLGGWVLAAHLFLLLLLSLVRRGGDSALHCLAGMRLRGHEGCLRVMGIGWVMRHGACGTDGGEVVICTCMGVLGHAPGGPAGMVGVSAKIANPSGVQCCLLPVMCARSHQKLGVLRFEASSRWFAQHACVTKGERWQAHQPTSHKSRRGPAGGACCR